MRFRDDYAAAGVPMLPVVAGDVTVGPPDRRLHLGDGRRLAAAVAGRRDRRRSTPVAAAVLGGAVPASRPTRLLRRARAEAAGAPLPGPSVEAAAMRLFHGSITYLTLLFLVVAIDPLLPF